MSEYKPRASAEDPQHPHMTAEEIRNYKEPVEEPVVEEVIESPPEEKPIRFVTKRR